MEVLIALGLILVVGSFIFKSRKTGKKAVKLSQDQIDLLTKHVSFYRSLDSEKRELFQFKVSEFLSGCKITGIKTDVSDLDKILVASSAVIPIFSFPEWRYSSLYEVLLYPSSFDENFNTEGKDRNILGMVGSGYMEGKMILSKPSLHLGFKNESDKLNTAIHEFIHLIDKQDGTIDGIPEVFLEKQYLLPWMDLIRKKMNEIHESESDIRAYGGTSPSEFLSVVGEYFFERPELMQKKHPELFRMLSMIFQQNPRLKLKPIKATSRNEPCPCGSGEKFKRCCCR